MPKFTSHEFCIEYLLLECMSIYRPLPRDTFWRLASSLVLFRSTLQDKTFQVFSVFWVVLTALLLLWQIYCSIILFPPSSCKQHHHGSVRMWQKYRYSALISGLLLFLITTVYWGEITARPLCLSLGFPACSSAHLWILSKLSIWPLLKSSHRLFFFSPMF